MPSVGSTSRIPSGGTTGQILRKNSATAFDLRWDDPNALKGDPGPAGPGVPTGGTTGQVLSKVNATDYNTQWTTASGGGLTPVTVNSGQSVTAAVGTIYLCSTSTANIAITLPASGTVGGEVVVKKVSSDTANKVRIDTSSSEVDGVSGTASFNVTAQNQSVVFVYISTGVWRIKSQYVAPVAVITNELAPTNATFWMSNQITGSNSGGGTFTFAGNATYFVPIYLDVARTLSGVALNHNTGSGTMQFAVYDVGTDLAQPTTVLYSSTFAISTGTISGKINISQAISAGRKFLAFSISSVNTVIAAASGATPAWIGVGSTGSALPTTSFPVGSLVGPTWTGSWQASPAIGGYNVGNNSAPIALYKFSA